MTDFAMVMRAVRQAAQDHDLLTTDDVWPLLEWIPSERNVVGKAFAEANRRGFIRGTEHFVKSKRPESKGRRVQVWRSVQQDVLL